MSTKPTASAERPLMERRESRVLEAGWEELLAAIGPECSERVVKQFKRYYYAGAQRVFKVLVYDGALEEGEEPTAEDLSKVDAIISEISEFFVDVEHGRQ